MTRPTLTDWPITAVATLTACAGGVWLGWQLRGVVPASARRPRSGGVTTVRNPKLDPPPGEAPVDTAAWRRELKDRITHLPDPDLGGAPA